MNQAQRIIKYVALAFGIFLAINIICGITFGFLGIIGVSFMSDKVFSDNSNVEYIDNTYNITDDIHELKVSLSISEFEIRTGDTFKVEVSNASNKFELSTDNGVLRIKDKEITVGIFNWGNKASKIVMYIPEGTTFDKVDISTGVGLTEIEYLNAKDMRLDLGVGSFSANDVIATSTSAIKGGVGRVVINNGELKNLNLDAGVGEVSAKVALEGNSKVDCGIGKINLTLIGNSSDYKINTKTGIGSVYLNGNKASDNGVYGNGENLLRVDGGIGSVEIRIENSNM